MTNINEQILALLKPLLKQAKAKDERVFQVCIIVDSERPEPWVSFHRTNADNACCYGVENALIEVKPHDPKAEKESKIAKLKAELAELEK